MFNYLWRRTKDFLKTIKLDIAYYYVKDFFYINRVAVTVEKDLSSLSPLGDSFYQAGIKLVAITPDLLAQEGKTQQTLVFLNENRRLQALNYLNKGYRGFALVKGTEVSGDIWYVNAQHDQKGSIHPDMKWLGIRCRDNDVYTFDMYLHPDHRGNNVANFLQNGALHEIKKQGFSRALGYYWADNIPALWVHRTLRWKVLERIKVTRVSFARYAHRS
jgi:GNAT superfamily N-acetyltransferase